MPANQAQQPQFRRKYPRRVLKRRVGVLSHGEYHIADTGEIGEGVVAIITEKEMVMGQQVILSFQIPGGEFVILRGQVRAVEPADSYHQRYGLSFENITFNLKRQIRMYVSARVD